MAFTAQDVKELREKTGCGMMDCKNALASTNGDIQAAVDYLREQGLAAATKKSGRIAAEGIAAAYTNAESNAGVALEINSETDFAAGSDSFKDFVKLCADTIIEKNPANREALLALSTNDGQTIEKALQEKVLTIGENIQIRRFTRFEGNVVAYIHAGGKIGVLVNFDIADKSKAQTDEFKTFAKDIAMQIAAAFPQHLAISDVPSETIEHEKKILKEQIISDGKPENIAAKIVEGRISKFYKEICLLEQPFVKDAGKSITQYMNETAKNLGTEIKIREFVRYEKGQGIEKKEDNFAEEVAQMAK